MPFVCDCIQIKGPVCDLITVFKCKCANVHLFKSVILSVMFVIIFSGNSALPLQLFFVVGEVFFHWFDRN